MKATAICRPLKLTGLMDKPVWVEQWPKTEEKRAAVVELVQREVQMGHLEPSTSHWNTPVFVIKKKSGAWRLLHDLRAVDACLQDMGALQPGLPSPAIVLKGQGVIVIDIKDCFFSIPLHPGDRERFPFSIPERNHQAPMQRYQWKVLPQGMKNSPTLCQIAVGKALRSLRKDYLEATIIHYMDDILLSHQDESALQHLYDQTIRQLSEYGLHVSPNKTQMGPSVSYLGTQLTPRAVTTM